MILAVLTLPPLVAPLPVPLAAPLALLTWNCEFVLCIDAGASEPPLMLIEGRITSGSVVV